MSDAINCTTIQALRSALMWQAVGDSLGYDFEFQKRPKEEAYYRAYNDTKPVSISDDTQMTYFGLRGVERFLASGSKDTGLASEMLLDEYKNWYYTQDPSLHYKAKGKNIPPEMFSERCPGKATMISLSQMTSMGVRQPNHARGCGGVMRLLPFVCGLLPDPQETVMAFLSGYLTHDSEESADAISKLLMNARLLVKMGKSALPVIREINHHILQAESITDLGQGFYAKECVDMALFALLNHPEDPYKLLETATVHSGDSDSVAAVAGCLYGLMVKEPPPDYLLGRVVEYGALEEQVKKVASVLKVAYN